MKEITAPLLFLIFSFSLILCTSCTDSVASQPSKKKNGELYQCLPCGDDCDKATYSKTGECEQCHMQLVKKSSITFKSIEPSTICDYIKTHPGAILLDVRTKEEFEGKANPNFGTLKNSINIPVQELESKLSSISGLKNKEVLVYCSHSHRSPRASYLLTQNGFTNVTNMAGGMSTVTDKACKN
ncbi:MAG: rhodanese [Segetibacter sp.]|jgi:rhodanese-related sulfurtransferase|nr:rhodanese [Segetibacter sp.]